MIHAADIFVLILALQDRHLLNNTGEAEYKREQSHTQANASIKQHGEFGNHEPM